MKKTILASMICVGVTTSAAAQYKAPVRVQGHTTREGVYVPPHVRTAPNETRTDNWSSKPNTNPYNGKAGTVDPYAPKPLKPYGSRY
jgi:hypothetical protein